MASVAKTRDLGEAVQLGADVQKGLRDLVIWGRLCYAVEYAVQKVPKDPEGSG